MGNYLGIEIGATKLQVVVGDSSLNILRPWRGDVDRDKGPEGIRAQLRETIGRFVREEKIEAIGVGFGGPINHADGRIACSHQVGGWNGFPLGKWLADVSGLPVVADNDTNVAALGETWAGAGVGHSPVFYFNLGSGVGGGLVIDGRIYHGILPGEVEFGHVRLSRDGVTVEQRCSGWAINRRIREGIARDRNCALANLVGDERGAEAKHLAAALKAGDTLARTILSELSEDLAFALSHVVHLFHPAIIIIGGGLALMGDVLRDAVAAALPKHVMEIFRPPSPISLAKLGENTVTVGGAEAGGGRELRQSETA